MDFSWAGHTSTHHSWTGAGASTGWAGCVARGWGRAERAVPSSNQCRLHSVLIAALNPAWEGDGAQRGAGSAEGSLGDLLKGQLALRGLYFFFLLYDLLLL